MTFSVRFRVRFRVRFSVVVSGYRVKYLYFTVQCALYTYDPIPVVSLHWYLNMNQI